VTAIAEHSKLPIENLISPDTVRRLSWDPPQPYDEQTVAQALAGYGARPWQIELTAGPVARALAAGDSNARDSNARDSAVADSGAVDSGALDSEAPDVGES
jgi:hypothetical protein